MKPGIERQTRDYNRNNTAPISIITDGQSWRFYLSQTGGEFSQKRFFELDLLDNHRESDDLQSEFHKFLSVEEIRSGEATQMAIHYLKRSRKEKLMEDAYPQAIESSKIDPATSLAAHLIKLTAELGEHVTSEEAVNYCRERLGKVEKPSVICPPIVSASNLIPPPQQARGNYTASSNRQGGRATTPDPRVWASSVFELRNVPALNTWRAICDYLNISVNGDSARRKLSEWVRSNRPNWPQVPEPR